MTIYFYHITNLSFLCSLESIYVEKTFEYCAKHFYQLFSIHSYKDYSDYVLLVFSKQAKRYLYKKFKINYPLLL